MANEQDRSRIENLLLRILGENVDLEEPLSRIEDLLYQVADIIVTLDSDGLIPINEIPPAAIEHMVTVANDTARFALTTDDVENGDTVYVDATKVMYMVVDDTHLDSETGYKEYSAGIATKAIADQLGNVINTYYQRLIDSSNKLSADLVDDTNTTNKFTNATEKQTWNGKQDALTFDSAPTDSSTNPVTSGGVYTALSGKQDTIDANNKLSADNVDDSNSTNKFNMQADWGQTTSSAGDYIKNKPTLGTASALDVPTTGDAGNNEVVKGNDSRLSDARTPVAHNQAADSINLMTGYVPESPTVTDSILASDTLNQAIKKLDQRSRSDENDISNLNQNKIGASDYATQNTGGTVRVWTTTDGTDTILHISNEAPTP